MAKAWIPFLNTPVAERLWHAAMAVLAGTWGNLILIFFFSGFTEMSIRSHGPYWIMAFNTALTGYMLIEKGGGRLGFRHILCAGAGLVNAMATLLVVSRFYVRMADEPMLGLARASTLVTMGAVCSVLGGALATKYIKLKTEH